MEARTKNFLKLQDIVRLGLMILVAIHVLGLVTEGASANLDYSILRNFNIAPKPETKQRDVRGIKPHSISTARGFGKRQGNNYQSSKLNHQETMMLSPLKDLPQRFPIEWFVQFLKMNPEVERKVERHLLFSDENYEPSVTQRYKERKNDVTYYYDE